jgi:hypothetical protein
MPGLCNSSSNLQSNSNPILSAKLLVNTKKILASSNVSSHKVTIHKEQEKSEIEKIREEITQLRKAQQELLASLKKDEQ